MHFSETPTPATPDGRHDTAWWKGLSRYQWFVFVVASLGWLFDTMDQQLFNLARQPAIAELIGATPGDPATAGRVAEAAGMATTIFIVGWAIGGLIFGILGDRIGRVKTMMITILLYSAFTGLSALSTGVWDFAAYRFLTGLGVGGEFAVGVTLVAEVMSDRARPHALGWLQALSAIGNVGAAILSLGMTRLEETGAIGSYWRAMFLVGIVPALLTIPIFLRVREPEKWKAAAARRTAARDTGVADLSPQLGSLRDLFGNPRWRHNTIVGMMLALAGVIGLWGIGFFSPDLTRSVFRQSYKAQGLSDVEIRSKLNYLASIVFLVQNIGAFFGIYAFSKITNRLGRRPTFAIFFILAMLSTAFTFGFVGKIFGFWDVFWMIPVMGFCQIALFGGYAIYFPELFPTHLRSTGTSFCYNVGRLVAAPGSTVLKLLESRVFRDSSEPARFAGMAMCAAFLIGLLALPFAPETKDQPLPE
ncbi:MAG: MFS transporter [Isosphaeraceae bacterium]